MTTANRIAALLVREFKMDPETLTADTGLEDMGIDSIGVAELLFAIEDEFGLKLPDVPADLATFGHVVRYVDEQIVEQAVRSSATGTQVNDTPPLA